MARQMADKSFAWAASRGLLRKNAVHGEEEARLVLKDYFQFNNEKGSMQTAKASGEVEDQSHQFCTRVVIHLHKEHIGLHGDHCLNMLAGCA